MFKNVTYNLKQQKEPENYSKSHFTTKKKNQKMCKIMKKWWIGFSQLNPLPSPSFLKKTTKLPFNSLQKILKIERKTSRYHITSA